MITIFKLGRTTFVLSNRQIDAGSPVFIGEILHRQEDEIPPVAIPLLKADGTEFPPQANVTTRIAKKPRVYEGTPNQKRRHLNDALKRILRFKPDNPNQQIAVSYGSIVRAHEGHTCHSSAMEFLKQNNHPKGNSQVYNLIAWALTYCGMDVTETYPMKYVKRGAGK